MIMYINTILLPYKPIYEVYFRYIMRVNIVLYFFVTDIIIILKYMYANANNYIQMNFSDNYMRYE